MLRTWAVGLLGVVVIGAAVADGPAGPAGLTPSPGTLPAQPGRALAPTAAGLPRQTGIPIDLAHAAGARPFPAALDAAPFWTALDRSAAATRHRLSITHQGIAVVPLADGAPLPAACVAGPFRVAARQAL